MLRPAQIYAITHPKAPAMPINSPDVTKIPIPIVPEKAIAMEELMGFFYVINGER